MTRKRLVYGLLAWALGSAVPIFLVLGAFTYAQILQGTPKGMPMIQHAHAFARLYLWLVYLPAALILLWLWSRARREAPEVARRLQAGFVGGFFATVALDTFREWGVIYKWLPGDVPALLGKVVTGSTNFAVFFPAGQLFHYLNGAGFGVFYAFLWGKRSSTREAAAWAVFWALLVELGMMTSPPMVPMVGLFGVRYRFPALFLITLLAHVAFGVALGVMVQALLSDEDRGNFFLQFFRRSREPG